MPQLDIITADLLLLFVMPACGLGIVVLILKFLYFIKDVYGYTASVLKDFYYKHYDFFLNLRCFFIMYGSYLGMFLVILYFYTLTFPAIVAFIRVPVFFITKVVLVVKIAKRILAYLERRRLIKKIKRLELDLLEAGGGPLALAALTSMPKVQGVLTAPNTFGVMNRVDKTDLIGRAREISDQHVNMLSDSGCFKFQSQEFHSIKRGIEAANTHYGVGFKYMGSNNIYSFGLTSKGPKLPKKFYDYDFHRKKVFESKTEFAELNNRIITTPSDEGQFIVTNVVQLRGAGNGIIFFNGLPSELRAKINPEFFDERLVNLLKTLKSRHNRVFEELNSALSEEEFLRALSKINNQGSVNIKDYRELIDKENDYPAILLDIFF